MKMQKIRKVTRLIVLVQLITVTFTQCIVTYIAFPQRIDVLIATLVVSATAIAWLFCKFRAANK